MALTRLGTVQEVFGVRSFPATTDAATPPLPTPRRNVTHLQTTAIPHDGAPRELNTPETAAASASDPNNTFAAEYATWGPSLYFGPDGKRRWKSAQSTDWRYDQVQPDPQDVPLAPKTGPKHWKSNQDIAKALARSDNPEHQAIAARIDTSDPGKGEWIDVTPQDIAEEERQNKIRFYETETSDNALGRIGQSFQAGANSVSQLVVRPFLPEDVAHELARSRGLREEAANRKAGDNWWERQARGVAGSLGQRFATLPAVILTGGAGAEPINALAAGAAKTNESYTEAIDAGLSHEKALAYAATQGTIEGGLTYAFGKLGKSGAQNALGKSLLKQLAGPAKNEALRQLGIQVGKRLGHFAVTDVAEETLIAVGQNLSTRLHGVDPKKPILSWSELGDIVAQSVLASKVGGTAVDPNSYVDRFVARSDQLKAIAADLKIPEGAARFAAENPDAARAVLANPTRGNIAGATGTHRNAWSKGPTRERFLGAISGALAARPNRQAEAAGEEGSAEVASPSARPPLSGGAMPQAGRRPARRRNRPSRRGRLFERHRRSRPAAACTDSVGR
jgi:hypothetical protein